LCIALRSLTKTPMSDTPKGTKIIQSYVTAIYWLATHHFMPYKFGAKIVNKTVPFLIRLIVR